MAVFFLPLFSSATTRLLPSSAAAVLLHYTAFGAWPAVREAEGLILRMVSLHHLFGRHWTPSATLPSQIDAWHVDLLQHWVLCYQPGMAVT